MNRVWSQTLLGRAFEFADPVVTLDHLLTEVPHGLATINRFAGATMTPYSVAQHCCVMAEAVESETGDVELAAFALLHDAHETWLGDWTSPAVAAVMEAVVTQSVEAGAEPWQAQSQAARVHGALQDVKRRIDRSVVEAAGLSWTRFEKARISINRFDMRALITERDDLMGSPPRKWDVDAIGLPRLKTRGRIKSWSWPKAEERWRGSFERLCAAAGRRASDAE